jgi:nitrite reductase/ring-hydroxylating ferredoxin subunit
MTSDRQTIALCSGADLHEGGDAVPFDVVYAGQSCRAFAIRFRGAPHAYLNRCTHVPMEMDYQPNRLFDDTGNWLLCATHGAAYQPDTGACAGGPCRGGLVKISLTESGGVVHWHTAHLLQPVEFPTTPDD